MSVIDDIKKEAKKLGGEIKNTLDKDKDDRAQDCFNKVAAAKGKICDINTKQEVTGPKVGITEKDLNLESCLKALKAQSEVPCSDLSTVEQEKEKQTKALSKLEEFKSISCKDNAQIADNMVKFFKVQSEASLNKVSWDANKVIQIETARTNGNFDPANFGIDWVKECGVMKNVAVEACKELHPDNTGSCAATHDEL